MMETPAPTATAAPIGYPSPTWLAISSFNLSLRRDPQQDYNVSILGFTLLKRRRLP
jgi:hypothetical protein